jgi:lipopolysaccharide transport system ATP-binding protein
MEMKKSGKTILFCSHALYQVEAICDTVLWLKHGKVARAGSPSDVVMAYNDSLNVERYTSESALKPAPVTGPVPESEISEAAPVHSEDEKNNVNIQASQPQPASVPDGVASIIGIQVCVDGREGKEFNIAPLSSDLNIHVTFRCATALPSPNVAVCFVRQDGQIVASTATHLDSKSPARTPTGGCAQVFFPALPLLKGRYQLDVYLMCEDGIHVYDTVNMAAILKIKQETLELGVVSLPHEWN